MRAVLSSALALSLVLPVQALGQAMAPSAVPPRPGAAVPAAFPSAAPASIVELKSYIEIERSGRKGRERVGSTPAALHAGDRVHTFRKGSATIEFRDGSRVVLGPYSIFTVEEAGADRISLSLAMGRLKAVVAKLRSRRFEVRTAVAVASVRGTVFDVVVRSPRDTMVSVSRGLVGVADRQGNEVLLNPGERVGVRPEGLERTQRDGRDGKREEEKDQKKDEKKEEARREVERELGFQTATDRVQAAAAFEMRSAQYASERNLTDAFGKRVRLTEYVTRPDDRSFKVVSLSQRDGQLDFGFFEVSANIPLPRNLNQLQADLFFHDSSIAPTIWAEKFRFVLSNGVDNVTQLGVDGQPKAFSYLSEPVFDASSGKFTQGIKIAHQTVFGNQYEFINGNSLALDRIWSTTFRPNDNGTFGPTEVTGMTYRMQPVEYQARRLDNDSLVTVNGQNVTFWDYAFVSANPGVNGAPGNFFLASFRPGTPFKAHFVERHDYLKFVDNGNGILDFGEHVTDGAEFGLSGVPVYFDKKQRLNGTVGVGYTDGTHQAAGDATVFADANGNGTFDNGVDPKFDLNYPNPDFAGLRSFARAEAREWVQAENFALKILNDKGDTEIFDFRSLDQSDSSAGQQNEVADIFRKLAFERVVTSSRFNGRRIDVLISGETILRAGLMPAGGGGGGASGP